MLTDGICSGCTFDFPLDYARGFGKTEQAHAVVRYGFEVLGLHRIHASHFSNNAASGKVLRKLGMKQEGRLRGHIVKWGERLDLELYGMVASEVNILNTEDTEITEEDSGRKLR